mmetsp:Transcript_46702/g.141491  ORF Transcript_46702/g.141491 Transcript_46702/m.141491 type:complete len:347 (+) Transcript_46702:218-1258(+)
MHCLKECLVEHRFVLFSSDVPLRLVGVRGARLNWNSAPLWLLSPHVQMGREKLLRRPRLLHGGLQSAESRVEAGIGVVAGAMRHVMPLLIPSGQSRVGEGRYTTGHARERRRHREERRLAERRYRGRRERREERAERRRRQRGRKDRREGGGRHGRDSGGGRDSEGGRSGKVRELALLQRDAVWRRTRRCSFLGDYLDIDALIGCSLLANSALPALLTLHSVAHGWLVPPEKRMVERAGVRTLIDLPESPSVELSREAGVLGLVAGPSTHGGFGEVVRQDRLGEDVWSEYHEGTAVREPRDRLPDRQVGEHVHQSRWKALHLLLNAGRCRGNFSLRFLGFALFSAG